MRVHFRNFDWGLLAALGVIAGASLVTLASSNLAFFWRQLVWYIVAFVVILFGSQFDWRRLAAHPWFRYGLYGLSILALVAAYLGPHVIRGTKSWLVLGPVQFEPEELAKLALILVLGHFFSRRHVAAWQVRNIVISLLYVLPPAILIILQPNFGSAVLVASIWVGFLLMGGINPRRFIAGLLILLLLGVLLWTLVLKDYQKERILGFLFPDRDPLGTNYNVIQSKIAIGSAGFWGKGFGGGTQTRLGFLPAAQNDFLFAAFIEEWGIAGGLLVLLTIGFILYRMVHIGLGARDNFAKFVVLGGGLFFLVHFLVNAGSDVGLLPVTGVTLPFFSYGGSNLLTAAVLIGIIEHIKLESSA